MTIHNHEHAVRILRRAWRAGFATGAAAGAGLTGGVLFALLLFPW